MEIRTIYIFFQCEDKVFKEKSERIVWWPCMTIYCTLIKTVGFSSTNPLLLIYHRGIPKSMCVFLQLPVHIGTPLTEMVSG